jgi:hypothetical protein
MSNEFVGELLNLKWTPQKTIELVNRQNETITCHEINSAFG